MPNFEDPFGPKVVLAIEYALKQWDLDGDDVHWTVSSRIQL